MRIVSIVNTNYSLPFDDRVNKESITLIKKGHEVNFIALETKNESARGTTPNGASFQTLHLLTRKFLPKGKFVAVKLLEWNIRIMFLLVRKKWDILWVNDYDGVSAILYGRFVKSFYPQKRIIWDHHELVPDRFLKSVFYRWLISFSDVVIHANSDRVHYTKGKLGHKFGDKFVVLENYPDDQFAKIEKEPINEDFSKWLNECEYCLFQGAALTYRKVLECIEAVYTFNDLKLVIMGPCDELTLGLIADRWPDYQSKVYITGWVPQSKFFSYMDKAIVSLVFYENIDENHRLCAPNRFFNAVLRGIPIICGSNPPMKRIVEEDGVGVYCENNGEDYKEIATNIAIVKNKQEEYKKRCFSVRSKFVWQTQEKQFEHILC